MAATRKQKRKTTTSTAATSKRKGPAQHASDTAVGTVVRGNDRKDWIVTETSTGIRRWVHISGHLIHDNGGRPFLVNVKSGEISVLAVKYNKDLYDNTAIYHKQVLHIPRYMKLFVGKNAGPFANKNEHGEYPGSSLLVHVSADKYIYIGSEIFEFTAPSGIKEFVSVMGHSDVPYPFAVGHENTYLLLEKVVIANSLRDNTDPYEQYYKTKPKTQKLRVKVLVKRQF